MMGQLSAFATSVQYGELRLFRGSVVNATCTHMCIMCRFARYRIHQTLARL